MYIGLGSKECYLMSSSLLELPSLERHLVVIGYLGQNPDQTPEGARRSLTEIMQLCTCFFCVCFLILITFLGYAASLKVVYFSSGQRLNRNQSKFQNNAFLLVDIQIWIAFYKLT